MNEPTAMLVLDFQISDEQKKKLLDGLCRLITRCDIQALKVGVKSPPVSGVEGTRYQVIAPSGTDAMGDKGGTEG